MRSYYALINKMTTKPGKRDEVISIMLESGKLTEDNPDSVMALVYADAKDPNVIWVEDVWKSKTAHTDALQNPTIRPFIDRVIPLLVGMPEQTEVIPRGGKGL